MLDLTPDAVRTLLANLPALSDSDKEQLLSDLEQLEEQRRIQNARDDFLSFCKVVYPDFKEGPHHRFMRPVLHRVLSGEETRVTISMPPRMGKSETTSYLFVAWYLGHYPKHNIIMCTHTADLSAAFGRKVRNLIDSDVYRKLFPDTTVSRDKAAANDWTTTQGGAYLAVGVGANIAGRGAHLAIIDDAVSEQAVLAGDPDKAFATAFEWLQVGPLQRLAPGGRVIFVGTRWGKKDPIGRALAWADNNADAPQWNEIRFPAILPSGKSLWPEQWPVEQLLSKKASLAPMHWAAQYMQEPTSEEGALIKREWWKKWPSNQPPKCSILLQSWDTAHETKNSSDPSAVHTWGVFFNEETEQDNLILLDAWQGRKEFPELKKFALEYYKEWEPDMVIIEKKAAGAPLIQELRAIGVPVNEYTPSRGNDKRVRINAVADIFASGMVWAPDTRWAQEVIDQIAEFPNSDHDEHVDCTSQALLRFRQGGFVQLGTDEKDDVSLFRRRSHAYY